MAETKNFVRLFKCAAETMKHAAYLPAVIAQDRQRLVPGVALMNDNIHAQLDRKVDDRASGITYREIVDAGGMGLRGGVSVAF